jgi:hypothetical protein
MLTCAVCVVLAVVGTSPVFGEDAPKKDGGGAAGGGPGGPGGGGRGGGFPGGRGNMRFMDGMLNRGMGIEQPAKVEDLPLGEAKRLVHDVPVGGVDGLQDGHDGWKMEEIFTMTPEQVQALTTLREEYKGELAKLQTEYDDVQKALAEKVKKLRLLYETKANDILIDPSKAEKAKLDALASEFAVQNEEQVKERATQVAELRTNMEKTMEEARRNNDWEKMREAGGKFGALFETARDQRNTLTKSVNEKMKESVTGDAKTKLEALLKQNTNPWQFGGGRGGDRGGRGGDRGGAGGGDRGGAGGGATQQPPKAPENF